MRVYAAGIRVQGSGFRVQGSGFRVQGARFRVQGSGFGGHVPRGNTRCTRGRVVPTELRIWGSEIEASKLSPKFINPIPIEK